VQAELGISPEPLQARFVSYESLPGKYQDVRHRIPDTAKAKRLLGFEATVSLEDGLRETAEWHRAVRAFDSAAEA
jgi:nucleoside-diphosphate-sugar epimerase